MPKRLTLRKQRKPADVRAMYCKSMNKPMSTNHMHARPSPIAIIAIV